MFKPTTKSNDLIVLRSARHIHGYDCQSKETQGLHSVYICVCTSDPLNTPLMALAGL